MSGGRLPVPFCNLLKDGFEECAERVHARLAEYRRDQAVIVDDAGNVFTRTPEVAERKNVPIAHWVGTYDHRSSVEQIEDDLLARQREIVARQEAA